MCGLIGMFSKELLNREERNALKELFVLTTLRGVDSTGLLHADLVDKNEYGLDKSEGNFYDLVENKPDSLMALKANVVMGHCRWSTMGASTESNAHPYVFKNFIGMHNGTLHDLKYDPLSFDNKNTWKKSKTDSFLFFHALNEVISKGGVIDDLVKDFSYRSAYAMVLWNLKRTITAFRNEDRTLFIGVSKENGSVVLSSEKRFLTFIENRKISFDIHEVEPYKQYEINLNEIGTSKTPWTVIDMTKKSFSWGGSGMGRNWDDDWWTKYDDDKWIWDKELGTYREKSEIITQ